MVLNVEVSKFQAKITKEPPQLVETTDELLYHTPEFRY
jgi:hypothetical protein